MTVSENPTQEIIEKPKELPQLSAEQIQKIQSRIPRIRQNITRLAGHFDNLRTNYPDEFERVNKKHPNLSQCMKSARGLFDFLGEDNRELPNEQLVQALNEYNLYDHEINSVLQKIRNEQEEDRETALISAVHGEMPFDEAELDDAQKAELRAFAQDLWEEFFPESGVDQFTRWATGQKDLEGYQKVLLAPANGIESAVVGMINLLNPKTYKELYTSIETMSGLSYEDWCDLWGGLKFTYEQLPTTDKIAPVVSLICSIALLTGGLGKITKIAKKMGYSTKMVGAIKGALGVRAFATLKTAGKVAPLGAMVGITLPYIKHESEES